MFFYLITLQQSEWISKVLCLTTYYLCFSLDVLWQHRIVTNKTHQCRCQAHRAIRVCILSYIYSYQ